LFKLGFFEVFFSLFFFLVKKKPIVIAAEGIIGVGKRTLLHHIKSASATVKVVPEPLQMWQSVCGFTFLQAFYQQPRRWPLTWMNIDEMTSATSLIDA